MLRSRPALSIALTSVAIALLAGCGAPDQGVTAGRSDANAQESATSVPTSAEATPTSELPAPTAEPATTASLPTSSGIVDFGQGKTPQPYDSFLDAAFADVTEFWASSFPTAYGKSFEPVKGVYALYPERTDAPQSCDGAVGYDQVEGNAFYTDCGDIIVYDDASLVPDLVKQFGESGVAVVAAHEYGHAIQSRAGLLGKQATIDSEQQADCFAGAWTAHVARGESKTLRFTDADINAGLLSMIYVRDPVGLVPDSTNNGHGTAFDRVGAFQEGFLNGVARCVDFPKNPNPRVDLPFLTQEEYNNGGNLSYDDTLAKLPAAMTIFWQPTLDASKVAFTPPTVVGFPSAGPYPTCDARKGADLKNNATYCAATNTIVFDEDLARNLLTNGGDMAMAYPIANAYGDAVQTALKSALATDKRVLLSDCLVGVWITDIIPTVDAQGNVGPTNPKQEISLSPGDLDEAIVAAMALADPSADTNKAGTAFEKVDAIRAGVLGGMNACQARIG